MLDQLLIRDFPGVAELREQAVDVQVVGRCECGCPSIYLATTRDHRPAAIADGLVRSELRVSSVADAPEGDVILFVKDGRLSYLEYVYYTDAPPSAVRYSGGRYRESPVSGLHPAASSFRS